MKKDKKEKRLNKNKESLDYKLKIRLSTNWLIRSHLLDRIHRKGTLMTSQVSKAHKFLNMATCRQ